MIKSELEAYLAEEHEEDTAEATDSAENMGTKVTAETEASVNLAESKNIAENIHKLYSPFQGVIKANHGGTGRGICQQSHGRRLPGYAGRWNR